MEDIQFSIRAQLANLSPMERRVGEYILTHVNDVIFQSTTEVAKAADVSPATIVRFCHAIGIEGFPELKVKLSAKLDTDQTAYEEINPHDKFDQIKDKLNLRINHAVEQTCKRLKEKDINQALTLFKNARVIYVYGIGASDIVASDFNQKFSRIGLVVIQVTDPELLATVLAKDNGQMVFFISNSGQKQSELKVAKLCQELGIKVALLTSNKRAKLREYADVVLYHDHNQENFKVRTAATTSLIAQLYVIDLLFYQFVAQNYQGSLDSIEKSHEQVKRFSE